MLASFHLVGESSDSFASAPHLCPPFHSAGDFAHHTHSPPRFAAVIACSRQEIELFDSDFNDCLKGGYLLAEDERPSYTLLATGSEVQIALKVAKLVPGARVVSLPCLEIFEAQPTAYQKQILGPLPRISIEAGVTAPWYKYADLAFGIDTFGKSASADDLFDLYLNPEKIAIEIKKFLANFAKS
jgi:transketolase